MLNRRQFLLASGLAATLPDVGFAQTRGKTAMVLGMVLEPPGLDPTANAASAVGEVVLYNVLETLVKIEADGSFSPLLAESWQASPDFSTYTFKLRRGLKFHNGVPFNAHAVKFSLDRAAGADSTSKDKRVFAAMSTQVVDDDTVVLKNTSNYPGILSILGQGTAVIVEPSSAASNATQPVGTGPFTLERWVRGSSLTLARVPDYAGVQKPALEQVTFRFIADPAAQAAALLAGDVDVFLHAATRIVPQFQNNPRYQTILAGTRAKTIVAINHRRAPLNDVRVRRALAAAIDRKVLIQGAADGFGAAIGSHFVPGAAGYVDTTAINPFDPAKAQALLQAAGVQTPLRLRMPLPPPAYARQGGEVIAAQLSAVGIQVQLQNVEWAQWIANVYGGAHDYDLTMVSHVEPYDMVNYTNPDYYFGYDSPAFRALFAEIQQEGDEAKRNALLGRAQVMLAEDAVNVFLFQPTWPTIARTGIQGIRADEPISCNELAALAWG